MDNITQDPYAPGAVWVHRSEARTRIIAVITDELGLTAGFPPGSAFVVATGIENAPHDVWAVEDFVTAFHRPNGATPRPTIPRQRGGEQ